MDNLEFETLTAEELKLFVDNQREERYLLIDVRQPWEYERGHIPGAVLMPLAEVETGLFSLPAERDLIFYCHNGGRSQWAASLAGEGQVCEKTVYHLMHGLLGWKGRIQPGYPRVQVFEPNRGLPELLETAMDLEKGAWRFYRHVMDRYPHDPIHPFLEQLAKAEKAHAELLYHFRADLENNLPGFERLYQSLPGSILESGQSYESACRQLDADDDRGCPAVIDLAMAIEFAAYDLYRTMAEQSSDPGARSAFLSIAQAEKAHMRVLTRALTITSQPEVD